MRHLDLVPGVARIVKSDPRILPPEQERDPRMHVVIDPDGKTVGFIFETSFTP